LIIWITGAPGVGKTTTAKQWQKAFPDALMLDGDEVRKWLTPDCGFSDKDRRMHALRVYEVAVRVKQPVIVSLIAHPPGPVDMLVWVDGPPRSKLWEGTTYTPPEEPDIVVKT
jgi:broad-specificity NMP kinase